MRKLHTDREYEAELTAVRERLVLMAGRVEEMIANAIRALGERDADLARRTIDADQKVNRNEVETDELCLRILARRQPLASDLRFITLALKMVTDLERIGDLAVNICERDIDLAGEPVIESYDELARMAQLVQLMVREAINAFVNGDAELAHSIIARDDEVDELYHAYFRSVLAGMVEAPAGITRGIHIQSIAKWLERIGDHATNLAELVIFMVQGKDVRHIGKLGG